MNSSSRNSSTATGALVSENVRTTWLPLALKCWYQAFSGMAKRAPFSHSKVCFGEPSYQMVVAPRPSEMNTISS
jgi:hypothetical protein